MRLRTARLTGTIMIALTGAAAGARDLCPAGAWVDAMVGAYHIHPDRYFDDFDPGVGGECGVKPEWTLAAGYFRNSVLRPSFYGGAIYAPEFAHSKAVRFGVIGGIISGYNFGSFGFGSQNHTGPIVAPIAMVGAGRLAANLFLIPPIAADHVPVTLGLQLKFGLR